MFSRHFEQRLLLEQLLYQRQEQAQALDLFGRMRLSQRLC